MMRSGHVGDEGVERDSQPDVVGKAGNQSLGVYGDRDRLRNGKVAVQRPYRKPESSVAEVVDRSRRVNP